jgi:hypothetical protein
MGTRPVDHSDDPGWVWSGQRWRRATHECGRHDVCAGLDGERARVVRETVQGLGYTRRDEREQPDWEGV